MTMLRVSLTAAFIGLAGGLSVGAQAGVITGGSYLKEADADQFETWLGLGDQDFTNVYTLEVGSQHADFLAPFIGLAT